MYCKSNYNSIISNVPFVLNVSESSLNSFLTVLKMLFLVLKPTINISSNHVFLTDATVTGCEEKKTNNLSSGKEKLS